MTLVRAVHSCDGNKDIGKSWIEFSIVIVKRKGYNIPHQIAASPFGAVV
jgi:hypothetical protein